MEKLYIPKKTVNILDLPKKLRLGPNGIKQYEIPNNADHFILIHGTADKYLIQILEEGVKPRKFTGNRYTGVASHSSPELCYWGDSAIASNMAWERVLQDGEFGKIYIQALVKAKYMKPDEDYAVNNWKESLEHGSVATDVIIEPSQILNVRIAVPIDKFEKHILEKIPPEFLEYLDYSEGVYLKLFPDIKFI